MPRRPRIVVEGAIYHVYNRLARGAEIFGEAEEMDRFVTLALLGSTREAARRGYLGLLRASRNDVRVAEPPGRLPWWQREPDRPPADHPAVPLLDPLGLTLGPARPRIDAGAFNARACELLSVWSLHTSRAAGRTASAARRATSWGDWRSSDGESARESWRLPSGAGQRW